MKNCDSCSHPYGNYTYMIENVMKVRFDSGSLCESGMTIEEYSKIKKAFISAYANQVKI